MPKTWFLPSRSTSPVGWEGYSPRLNKHWALLYIVTCCILEKSVKPGTISALKELTLIRDKRKQELWRAPESYFQAFPFWSCLEANRHGEAVLHGGSAAGASASSSVRHFLVTSGRPLRFFLGFKKEMRCFCFKSLVVAKGTWEERPVVRVRFLDRVWTSPKDGNGGTWMESWGVWTLIWQAPRGPATRAAPSQALLAVSRRAPQPRGICALPLVTCTGCSMRWPDGCLWAGAAGEAVLSSPPLPWLICWDNLVGRKVFKFPHRQGNAVNTSMSFHSSLLPTASRTSFRPGDRISATGLNEGFKLFTAFSVSHEELGNGPVFLFVCLFFLLGSLPLGSESNFTALWKDGKWITCSRKVAS